MAPTPSTAPFGTSDGTDFFDRASVALQRLGPDGRVLAANEATLELLGFELEEYVGHPITEFHVDPGIPLDILARVASGETVRDRPARLRCKDGSIRDVLVSSNGRLENGRLIHTRCITIDVTDHRRAEAELRESEERYRLLSELLPVAVYTCAAPSGEITYYNEQAARLWGRTPRVRDTDERFCGSFRLFLPDGSPLPHDRTPMALAMREGRRFRDEEVVIERPDGSSVTVQVNIDPILDRSGRIVGAVNAFHDVTEQKRAQRELRDQKENLQTLLETLPLAVFIAHDPEARVITGNPAAAELLRMPPGSNLSMTAPGGERPSHFRVVRDGEPVPPESLPIQRAARGEIVEAEPVDHRFDDGTTVHTLIWARPLTDAAGRPRGSVASILDITELRSAERSLREAARRKDRFLATLAHELRNPLAPIGYALEIMKHSPSDAERLQNARDTMARQLAHLVRLVDDLLDVSRITRDRLELRLERVELSAILTQAVETCRPLLDKGAHELTLDLPPDPVMLDADPVRLTQVFGNLLGNSCKYTDPGGAVRVSAVREGDEVVVSVRDTGIGLAPGALERVFDMFTQVDASRERLRGGLGIGLTLAKGLAEMHGGSMRAYSEGLGRGSTFVVRLPTAAAGSGPAPDRKTEAAAPSAVRRVLVVDDNREAADSLALLLETTGHTAWTAYDGPDAVAAIERLTPEVVLLDIGLPGMNGYEVCRAARSRPGGDRLTVVALTGWGRDEDRRQSHEAGFDGHLVKPVAYGDLEPFLANGGPGREGA